MPPPVLFQAGSVLPESMLHRNKNPVAFRARLLAALDRGRARAGPVDGIGRPVQRQRRELFAAARALFAADDEAARILAERLALAVPLIGEIGRAHVRTPVTNAQLVCRL